MHSAIKHNLQHNTDYVLNRLLGRIFCFLWLNYQPHIFHTLTVFRAGGDNINSCCVYA